MAVTPKLKISEIAACDVVASVRSVNSSPLGKNVSQWAKVVLRAARTCGSRTTSLRMFGSKETEAPLLFTSSIAFAIISIMGAEDSEAPETCRWSHSPKSSNAACVNRN